MGELVTVNVFRKKRAIYDLKKLFDGEDEPVEFMGIIVKKKFLTMYDGVGIMVQDLMDIINNYIDIIRKNNLHEYYDELDMLAEFYEKLEMQLIMYSELG